VTGYIVRHWRGELGPGVTWWVNCVVVSAALWWAVPRWRPRRLRPLTRSASSAPHPLQFRKSAWCPCGRWWGCGVAGNGAAAPDRWQTGRVIQSPRSCLPCSSRAGTRVRRRTGDRRARGAALAYSHTVPCSTAGVRLPSTAASGLASPMRCSRCVANGHSPPPARQRGGALSGTAPGCHPVDLDTYVPRVSSACVSAFAGGRFRYLQRGADGGAPATQLGNPRRA
jgi:hypothetical protein